MGFLTEFVTERRRALLERPLDHAALAAAAAPRPGGTEPRVDAARATPRMRAWR